MARGNRFARGENAQRDAAGHSLPSDRSMSYVELQILCMPCLNQERVILGAWWIESHSEKFEANQVNERKNKDVVTHLVREADGSTRTRYKLRCPKCRQEPVLRQDTVDHALGGVYQQGARQKVVPYAI